MKTYRLTFPSKSVALPLLYSVDEDGNVSRLYEMFDGSNQGIGDGIPTQRATDNEGNEYLTLPDDGIFNVNIRADALPDLLLPFVVNPNPQFYKHKYAGEEKDPV